MDKSWINESRVSSEYEVGVKQFLDFAFDHVALSGMIPCPCKNCNNVWNHPREVVLEHLICYGFDQGYARITWGLHGETTPPSSPNELLDEDEHCGADDMHGMLNGAFGIFNADGVPLEEPNAEAARFYKLMEDAKQELYPGCKKFSKLSFIVRLFHIKCLNGWSDKSFTMLLELLKEALPVGETLPKSFYESKKIVNNLGLEYNKIDACPNDCILYWKQYANDVECKICGSSRWKASDEGVVLSSTSDKKVPAKVLRHFPLKPRLQRLYMSTKTSDLMSWHVDGRTKDGVLRHPADSKAWETLDNKYPDFAAEPRNVRLGLASDGFNPFGSMSITHSTWPVVLMPYNLPPWLCMKQSYFMIALLIPGPRAPGNDIDVYLQPLIDELKELWEDGLHTYDASTKQNFTMRAALLWTINDFPAYANLSGWSTRGKFACPHCNMNTWHKHLSFSRKFCYMGHRRFLELGHRFRRDKSSFDGQTERRRAPATLSGTELLEQLCGVNITLGKDKSSTTKKKSNQDKTPVGWKKKSIFFTLPYWEHLLLRHNLDVMHIEKNICDSIVGTLLNIDGKNKDTVKARLDLQKMKIRSSLYPTTKGNKTYLPPACFTMAPEEKDLFCKVLARVKVPDGYAANISRCVNRKERKLSGLKSHDCHILMQQLLPIALRRAAPKEVAAVIIEFSSFFRELCSKVGTVDQFTRLESRIALTLCHLERIFPPAFFDIMVHLPIHLAGEAKVAGPVQYRWMYPIERYLHTLKSYVRNKSRSEGSIAEGYLAEECLTFCSRYLSDTETKLNRIPRNNDDYGDRSNQRLSIFSSLGRAIGKTLTTLQEE